MNLILIWTFATVASAQPAAPAKDADLGKKVFAAKCVTCHAKDGKGSSVMAKMFKADPKSLDLTGDLNQKKTDAELTKVINDGNGKMPAFKGKLKDGEIAGSVAYIRSLAAPTQKAESKPAAKPGKS